MRERETEVLHAFLAERQNQVSSALAIVEVHRAVARAGQPASEELVDDLLQPVDLVWLDREILTRASQLPPVALRAIDAIHLATALTLGEELESFVSYDRRQLEGASLAGMSVEAPGA